MKVPFLDLRAQHLAIKREISAAIASVIDESAFIGGRHVTSFENAFSRMHGAKYAVGVGNGTDALAVALFSVGVRSGDEVITVANSFIATSEAISVLGARVVFADCDDLSYTIDTSLIEEHITAKTGTIAFVFAVMCSSIKEVSIV